MNRVLLAVVALCVAFLVAAAPPVVPKRPSTSYRIYYTGGAIKDETKDLTIEHASYLGDTKVQDTGTIVLKAINRQRQAQGVSAMLTSTAVTASSQHWVDGRIDPPGWKDDHGLTRLMLWPYSLGGSGYLARNLVTVNRATVVPKYTAVMTRIRDAIRKESKEVTFSVTPVYRDGGRPTSLVIKADVPIDGDKKEVTITNDLPAKKARRESDLTLLKRIMPPPRNPIATGTAERWKAVEKRLKLTFPEDYKQFVTAYGSGMINEFVRILNPFRASEYDDFEESLKWYQQEWPKSKQMFPDSYPYDIWPAEGGLVPLGSTANGDAIFWRARGKPDEWTIIVHDRGGDGWRELKCGWVAFLRRAFEEDIQLSAWSPVYLQPKFVLNRR
jgi:hypothetical protein